VLIDRIAGRFRRGLQQRARMAGRIHAGGWPCTPPALPSWHSVGLTAKPELHVNSNRLRDTTLQYPERRTLHRIAGFLRAACGSRVMGRGSVAVPFASRFMARPLRDL
jgi:hypothetical protein